MFTESQQNNNNNQVVKVYVKQVYTCLTQNYELSDNLSIDEMVYQLGINILRDYHFNRHKYELVEVGNNNNNINAEEADPIINSSIETIRSRYNTNNIAFYIRPIQPIQSNDIDIIGPYQCIICWNSDIPLTSYHENCSHVMCADCRNIQIIREDLDICYICR